MDNLRNRKILGKNLEYYINLHGMNKSELARAIDIAPTTVYDWFNAKTYPRMDKIELMADYFRINKSKLVEPMESKENKDFNSIPLVGTIAAGSPILALENIEDYFTLDSQIKADFCLKIRGDSMVDEGIYDEDIVFIRKQEDVENGEIGAVIIDDEATLKKIFKSNGNLILQPANKKYQPMIIKSGNVRIVGKLTAVLNIRE